MKKRIRRLASIICLISALLMTACSKETGGNSEATRGEESGQEMTSPEETIGQTQSNTESEAFVAQTTEQQADPLTVEELRQQAERKTTQPLMTFYNNHDSVEDFVPEPLEVTGYWTNFDNYVDIEVYTVFPSAERQSIAYGEFRALYQSWWDAYEDHETTHIGYELVVRLKDGSSRIATVKGPEDTAQMFSYIEIYLYDDVHHAYGEWYSHVTQLTEDTYLTGIKLTPGEHADEVCDMTLTVFTYQSEEDFEVEEGRYIGGNYQTIHIANGAENT